MSPESILDFKEDKADQLKFNLNPVSEVNPNPPITTDSDQKNKTQPAYEILQYQDEEKVKRKKPTIKELKKEKKYFRQLWKLEGKGGVHENMQKLPPNRPDVYIPRQIYVDQEKKDWRSLHPEKNKNGFRLRTNPSIVLTDEQFSAYAKSIMCMSEEDKINLALTNAEIYDRKRLAGMIEAKCSK